MQTFRELITKWGFQVDDKPLDGVEKRLDSIKNRLNLLVATEILRGLANLAEKFGNLGEELKVAAESAGITVEAFQKLAFAAGQSNISQEQMGMAMARLARNIEQARMGGEQAQFAFQKIGISAEQVRGFRSSADALRVLSDRFSQIHDPILKEATALQLMGRGAINFISFLSQGSGKLATLEQQAQDFGAVLSGPQVEALVKVEHAFNALWAVTKAIGATFASYLAPSIETAIKDFLEFYKANKKIIDAGMREWAYDFTFALGFVYEAIKFVVVEFLKFYEAHGLLVRRAIELILVLEIFAGIIFALKGVFSVLMAPLGIIINLFKGLKWILTLFIDVIIPAVITGVEAVADAFLFLGEALLANPIALITAAIVGLIVVLHDAWKLLTGGSWNDTWVAKAFNAVKGLGGRMLKFFGIGDEGEQQTPSSGLRGASNLLSIPSIAGIPGTFAGQTSNSDVYSQGGYSVQAPISITIQGNADPKTIGQKVKEGIAEHLDRVKRQTQQSFTPSVHY